MASIFNPSGITIFAYRGVFFTIEPDGAMDACGVYKVTDEHGHEDWVNSATSLKGLRQVCDSMCNDREEQG